VYMGQWMKPARELAERSAGTLASRPVWLFSSGPVGEPAKPADNPVDVTQILQATKARDHQIFTGKLAKKHLSFPDRAMASAIRAQEGDFRNWAQIRDWATGIADTLLFLTPAREASGISRLPPGTRARPAAAGLPHASQWQNRPNRQFCAARHSDLAISERAPIRRSVRTRCLPGRLSQSPSVMRATEGRLAVDGHSLKACCTLRPRIS